MEDFPHSLKESGDEGSVGRFDLTLRHSEMPLFGIQTVREYIRRCAWPLGFDPE
jgi:hypothetical protein